MLDALRGEDVVVVIRLDRLARSTKDLLEAAEILSGISAGLRSLAADTTSPAGRMSLTVFAGIAEFERSLIHQRARSRQETRRPLEIEHFFTASATEVTAISGRRTSVNRMAFALQLGFLKMTGRTLNSVEIVPPAVLKHLGRQIGSSRGSYRGTWLSQVKPNAVQPSFRPCAYRCDAPVRDV